MKRNHLPLLLPLILICSCAKPPAEQIVKIPEPLEEIHHTEDTSAKAGSLWSKNTKSIFVDHKAQSVGDIVTVTIAESSSASKSSSTSSGRTSSIKAGIPNFFGLEKNPYVVETGVDLGNLLGATFDNAFNGKGVTERSGKLSASLTTQVIGVYPNGNLKIRGGKEVMVNNEVQIIYLTGIIRPVDVTAANTIDSNKILNARISYTGKGVISDKQNPGWMTRTIDNIWPF